MSIASRLSPTSLVRRPLRRLLPRHLRRQLNLVSVPASPSNNVIFSDQASSDLMSTVTQGISDAQAGIGKIAQALFTGQQAPAEDRDQVASGLGAAIDAAGSLDT